MVRVENDRRVLQEIGQKNKSGRALIPETAEALVVLSGFLLALRDLCSSVTCLGIAWAAGCLVILLLQIIRGVTRDEEKLKRVKTVIFVVCIIAFVLIGILNIQGILEICNRFLTLCNIRFSAELPQFSVQPAAGIGSFGLWIVLAAVIGAFLASQMEKHKLYGTVIILLISMFLYFVLGSSQNIVAAVCLLAGSIGLMIQHATSGRNPGKRALSYLAVLAVIAAGIILASSGYSALQQLSDFRANVVAGLERFRYGDDSLPRGDLQEASGLLEGSDVTLHLEMEEPQELYLRGFVGGSYTGTKWETLSSEAYLGDNEGMLSWLDGQSFQPVTQYAEYDALTCESLNILPDYKTVSVKNEGAYRKYLYLPANAASWSGTVSKTEKDWLVKSRKFRGDASYEFQMTQAALQAQDATAANWLSTQTRESQNQYMNAEAVYHSFVEENYTAIGDNLKGLLEETFFPDGTEDMDFTELTRQIRLVLRGETVYKDTPQQAPKNVDYVSWFLSANGEGNATAYATTAVMAYRTAGYPARYVEGYHLDQDTADQMQQNGETSVDLTAKNAHAWVEVYVDGIGWLPVEVVPGMYVEQYTNQIVTGKPTYQINKKDEDNGLKTSPTNSGAADQQAEDTDKNGQDSYWNPQKVGAVILLCLYVIAVIFIVLEIQRCVRQKRSRKNQKELTSEAFVEQCVAIAHFVMKASHIEVEYADGDALWQQMQEHYPDFTRGEYDRIMELIQKVRFGGKELTPGERRVLKNFSARMLEKCYRTGSLRTKWIMRYYYLM